jgi:hypothetical protein
MQIVHINRPKIKQDKEREDLKNILRQKWEEKARAQAQKKYAALYDGRRT